MKIRLYAKLKLLERVRVFIISLPSQNILIIIIVSKSALMGANNSQSPSIRAFDKEEWQAVPLIPYTNIKDPLYASNFRVLANKLNPTLQIEKYDLYFTTYKQYCSYKQFMSWRNSNRFTVQVKYVSQPQRHNFCATFYQGSICVERIPIRLAEIEDISIEEGLCILNSAYQGFQQLFQKFRYFQIEPEHICFTKEGYVKVWVNKNLSKNLPQTIFDQNKTQNYDSFMERLLNVVQDLIDFEGFHSISTFIQANRVQNPYQNLSKIFEEYAKYVKIKVPRYLNTIRNLCERDFKMKNLASKRRNSVASYKLGNQRNSISLKSNNNKQLQINQQAFNIAIKSPVKHNNSLIIEPFDFSKKQHQPNKNTCFTSRAVTVRFSYKNSLLTSIPSSEHIRKEVEKTAALGGPLNSSAGPEFIGPNKNTRLMQKKRSRYTSVFENSEQIDPDIAEDLKKLIRH